MNSMTRFRFTVRSLEQLPACPIDRKAVEYSDIDQPGLKLAQSRTSQTFWYRFIYKGKKGAIRLGRYPNLSIQEARQLALAYRTRIEHGEDPRIIQGEDDAHWTFKRFVQEVYLPYSYQHKRSYRDDISKLSLHILPRFGSLLLTELKRRNLETYLGELRLTHSDATVNRHLTLLSAILRRAVAFDYLARNPCTGISRYREDTQRQRNLSAEELARLLMVMAHDSNTVAMAAIHLLILTGTRKSECLNAKWTHINFAGQTWLLPHTKAQRSRYVQLNDAALALLEQLPSRHNSVWLFPGREPSKPLADPRKAFARVLAAAGIEPMCLHSLRHTFASLAVSSGQSLYSVQALLGHASPTMTQRYAHIANSTLRGASQAVADVVGLALAQATEEQDRNLSEQ
jgi:integrase